MIQMKNEIVNELKEHIIPFWNSLEDPENGGFYGELTFDLELKRKAEKGVILNSRILWFYAKAYLLLDDESLLHKASHAYEFLKKYCVDQEQGGVYWSLEYNGNPLDTTKHTYNQAFAIYALSAYYLATKEDEAIDLAMDLYHVIETKCRNTDGYLECFTKDFKPELNDKLSENGVIAERTMNTLLHVFEGYSGLYEATKDAQVEKSMREILVIFKEKIYNKELKRQEVFFDLNYNTLLDLHSYGHDIETAWLMEWGCDLLEDQVLSKEIKDITSKLVANVYGKAFTQNGFINECEAGKNDFTRVWWVQSEAILGFTNEWMKYPEKLEYKEAAKSIWNFTKEYIIDKREGGEWYSEVGEDLLPTNRKSIVEPWKCPYHNGRMCLEIMKRL